MNILVVHAMIILLTYGQPRGDVRLQQHSLTRFTLFIVVLNSCMF